MYLNPLILLAQATGDGAAGGQPPGPGSSFFLMMALIAVAFWFLILRPQNKERRNREELLKTISKGDKVVTAGGIHGKVTDAGKEDSVVVEVAKGVKLTFNRSSISVLNPDKDKEQSKEQPKDGKK